MAKAAYIETITKNIMEKQTFFTLRNFIIRKVNTHYNDTLIDNRWQLKQHNNINETVTKEYITLQKMSQIRKRSLDYNTNINQLI